MSNKRYEDLLAKLPRVLEEGLESLKFTKEMRDSVRSRLNYAIYEKTNYRRKISLACVPVILIILFLAVAGTKWLYNRAALAVPPTASRPHFTEIETIDIDLDGEEPLELVNTWRVRGNNEETLLALIWARDARGQLNVVSSHPFEGKDFLPLFVLSPAKHKGNLVFIASTDGANKLYYCVLGYDGNEVFEYREMSSKHIEQRQQMLREIELLFPTSITNNK